MPLSDRDYMRNPPPSGRRRVYQGFSLNPVMLLIAINFVVFIATMINGRLIDNLGLSPSLFTQRPWTILTSMFVHEGFGHIFGNMLTLYFFGVFLYRLVGQNRFLLLYFGGGLLGNVLFLLLNMSSGIPVVGASGAVYAIAGALVVMMPRLPVRLYFIIPVPLWVVVLVFFVLWSFIPGVAWQAHIGGLAAGLVAGYFFRRGRRRYYYR